MSQGRDRDYCPKNDRAFFAEGAERYKAVVLVVDRASRVGRRAPRRARDTTGTESTVRPYVAVGSICWQCTLQYNVYELKEYISLSSVTLLLRWNLRGDGGRRHPCPFKLTESC